MIENRYVRLDPAAIPERTTSGRVFKLPGLGLIPGKTIIRGLTNLPHEMGVHLVYAHVSGIDEITVGFTNPHNVPIIPWVGEYFFSWMDATRREDYEEVLQRDRTRD
jgi:hypothetical protein